MREKSAKLTSGTESTKDFHRLFLIPSMAQCARCSGCLGDANIPIPSLEKLFQALVEWVELKKQPDVFFATSVDGKISRPIYTYSRLPVYDGVDGDVKMAASFSYPVGLSNSIS